MKNYYLPKYYWLYLLILAIAQIFNRMSDLIFHHSKHQYIINSDIFYFLFSLLLLFFVLINKNNIPKHASLITSLIIFDSSTSLFSDFFYDNYYITVFTSIEYTVVLILIFLIIKTRLKYGR